MVKSLLSSFNFNCQNPEFASILEKIVPSDSRDSISLTLGNGYISRFTPLLSLVRSTHKRIAPFGLGAMVSPEHHSVGISTGSITFINSILSISSFTFSLRPAAILRGVIRQ